MEMKSPCCEATLRSQQLASPRTGQRTRIYPICWQIWTARKSKHSDARLKFFNYSFKNFNLARWQSTLNTNGRVFPNNAEYFWRHSVHSYELGGWRLRLPPSLPSRLHLLPDHFSDGDLDVSCCYERQNLCRRKLLHDKSKFGTKLRRFSWHSFLFGHNVCLRNVHSRRGRDHHKVHRAELVARLGLAWKRRFLHCLLQRLPLLRNDHSRCHGDDRLRRGQGAG
ncbi:unnamed protein product [Oikopleura dioica]|uniref:Uncharacterized protein n=1 Tax=Oikopleura dioica TaxID=34765 RepID=E4XVE8_OIKDI|nr:unnamed protein product [Oikopleura dioica]